MNNIDAFLHTQTPTAARPLLGMTVLLVEDSLTACEAMRLMCLRSGARIRRADCLDSARRHLRVYRPSVVIIDMGLPDGSGADLIAELSAKDQMIEVIIGLSADPDQRDIALQAGAHGFVEKPIKSIAEFQSAIIGFLPEDRRPLGPRRVDASRVKADKLALQEDLALALNLLEDGDDTPITHAYLANFLSGVAQTAADDDLKTVTQAYADARSKSEKVSVEKAQLSAALIDRLAERATI